MAERRSGVSRRTEDSEILAMKERIEKAEQDARDAREGMTRFGVLLEENRAMLQTHLITCAASSGRMESRQEAIEKGVNEVRDSIGALHDRSFHLVVAVAGGALCTLLAVGAMVVQTFVK